MFKLPKGQINQVSLVLLRHQRDIPPPKNFYQAAGARSMKGTSVHLRMQKANHSIGFYGDLQGMVFNEDLWGYNCGACGSSPHN